VADGNSSETAIRDITNSVVLIGDNTTYVPISLIGGLTRRRNTQGSLPLVDDYEERTTWLKHVNSFLGGSGGYLLIEGPAGVGKTTFLAHLARAGGYPCGFVGSDADPHVAIVDLGYQLVDLWKLPRQLTRDLHRSLETSGDVDTQFRRALEALFGAAAERAHGPVVVVLDGIGSDGPPLSRFLPSRLPHGVYAIIGQRAGSASGALQQVDVLDTLINQTPRELRQWVERATRTEPLSQILQRANLAPTQFADALTRKAGSVWIYAHYVVSDVQSGALDPFAIDALPSELWRYFKHQFAAWSQNHDDTWASRDLPALATLAAATANLTVTELAAVVSAGNETQQDPDSLRNLFAHSWISFLSHPEPDVFTCYHPSLRDFLSGSLPVTQLTADDRAFQEELQRAFVQAHRNLADYYRQALADDASQTPEQRSALRASAAHHYAAIGALDAMDRLLIRSAAPLDRYGDRHRPRNDAFNNCENDGDIGGYLQIVRAATDLANAACRDGSASSSAVVRYAMIGSSVTSMATNLPTGLLRAVLSQQIWPPREVLRHIEATQNKYDRARKLAAVLPKMTGAVLAEGTEMLAQTGASESIGIFLRALETRLSELPDEVVASLFASVSIEELAALAPILCNGTPDRTLMLLRRALSSRYWNEGCASVVRRCGEQASQSLREALVREIRGSSVSEKWRALALAELVPLLREDADRIELAQWVAKRLTDRSGRDWDWNLSHRDWNVAVALGCVATVLPEVLSYEEQSLSTHPPRPRRWLTWFGNRHFGEIQESEFPQVALMDPEWLGRAHCAAVRVALNDSQKNDHASRAFDAIRAISDNTHIRGELLVLLADVADGHLDVRACVNQIPYVYDEHRPVLLQRLLPRMSDDDRAAVLAWAVEQKVPHLAMIAVLLPQLSQPEIETLLTRTWPDEAAHQTLERHRLLLSRSDEGVLQRYLDATLPDVGGQLNWETAARLEAVCAAPGASIKQVDDCVQRVVDSMDGTPRGDHLFYGVWVAGLPKLSPTRIAAVAERIGVFTERLFLNRAKVLVAIAGRLPATHLEAVISVARTEDDAARLRIIESVAERLPRDQLIEAIDVARSIGDEYAWSSAVSFTVGQAGIDARRKVALATWPFRSDAPSGFRSAFQAASKALPTADALEMLQELRRELDGEPAEPKTDTRFNASHVLYAALESGSAAVSAQCADLAMEYGMLCEHDVVRSVLATSDAATRTQVVDFVLQEAHKPDALEDFGRLNALIDILGFLSEQQFLASAHLAEDAPVRLLVALAEAWPGDQLGAIVQLIPWARAAADRSNDYAIALADASAALADASTEGRIQKTFDGLEASWPRAKMDRDCAALRAIASRCDGALRQELYDEVLTRLQPHKNSRSSDLTVMGALAPEISAAAANRLRAALLKTGQPTPDYLLRVLATKLPFAEAIAAARDAVNSPTPPLRDDARRLIEDLLPRLDEAAATEIVGLVLKVAEERHCAELLTALAPALSPELARRALAGLADIPVSKNRRLFRGEESPATVFVKARHALASRLAPTECARLVDEVLAGAAKNAPDWSACFVPDLVPDASPLGHQAAKAIAAQLHPDEAVLIYLAVATAAETFESRADALDRATKQLDKMRPGAEKARLLSEAARATDPPHAELLFKEALEAAEACSSLNNEKTTVLLDVIRNAPPEVRITAITRAILAYDMHHALMRDLDPLIFSLGQATLELGPACDGVVASVAYACRDKPRQEFLNRLAIVALGASHALGAAWADDLAITLTEARLWWP
jgi:hypothetical protein